MKNRNYILSLLFLSFVWISAQSQTYLISDGGTINTCSGTLYDSGGASGDYGGSENYSITICSDNPGSTMKLTFTEFDTESGWDELSIYDGTSSADPSIIIDAGGTTLDGQIIESSGECIHLVWSSDGSVNYPGFAAEIACAFPCQDYTIDIVSSDPPLSAPTDSLWINVCQGEEITLTAQGNYPNSGVNYTQSDATTTWKWIILHDADGEEEIIDDNTLTYTIDEEGGYFVNLVATDVNGCEMPLNDRWRLRSSLTPTFAGTNVTPEVCPGDVVDLEGFVQVEPWVLSIPEVAFMEVCFEDVVGVDQEHCFTHNAFAPGQTITSADQVESICMNMEHSYTGDLDIWIECPNGQTVMLFEQACGGSWFGEPDHADDCNPGIGYNYCWSMSAPSLMSANCNSGSSMPAGDYLPVEDFSSLIGCPINGDWCIHFLDNLNLDDGNVFSVELHFSDDLIPGGDNLWSYTTEYDTGSSSTDLVWTGENVNPGTGGTQTANPTSSGTVDYVFTVTDDFGCSYDTTLSVNVLSAADPLCCEMPSPNAGADDQVCTNTYTLHTTLSNPINTITWTQISGPGTANFNGQENSTDPTVTVDQYGVYEFELYEENAGPACSATDIVQIAFYQTPTPTFTTTFVPCYENATTVTYIGNASSSATYTWGFDGGLVVGSGQGPYQVNWTEAGVHPVSLVVEENGCFSNDTTINVLVPEELTYNLTVVDDPCYNSCEGFAQIDVQGGTPPYDYSWGSTNINDNLCVGDYGITVVDNNGCEVSQTYTINQPPELIINNITTQDLTCFNSNNGEIHIDAVGGTGQITYLWSDGGMGPDRINMPAGNYGLTVSDENGCSLTEFITLTQPDELLLTISPDDAICEGESAIVSTVAVGGTQPYTYYWDSGSGFNMGTNLITVTPDTTTTYFVYVEDANGCISPTVRMKLIVSQQMYMTLITEDNRCFQSCDGEASLQIDGGIPPLNYSWASDGSILQNICSGLYSVTVTDVIGCQVDTVFFIDEPPQMFANIFTEDASCYGYDDGQAIVEVVGGVPGYTYLWPNGSTNDTVNLGAGVHEVTISDANDCRLNLDAVIHQPDELRVQLVGGDRWICQTNSTQLNAQAIGGTQYYDFYWTGNDGSSYVIHNPVVSPDSTTVYTVSVVDSHGCSSAPRNVEVKVYPDLEINYVVTSYDSICAGEPAIIEVGVEGGNGGPYYISLQDGQIVPAPFTVYPQETTNYILTLHDECGTPTVKDSILITVMPKPPVSFTSDKVEGCPPLRVQFNEMNEDEGRSYLWNFGDDSFAFTKNPVHVFQDGGSYPITLTVTSEFGCKNTKLIENMINVFPKPIADFYPNNSFVSILDSEIQFFNVSELAESSYWFFGDGDSSSFVNPSHNYSDIGEYEVYLVVESELGCLDTMVKTINVRDVFTFYAPTAFSPNGDGDNDFFMIYGNGIDPNEFYLSVYDRWGELVFETDVYDPDRPQESAWDGTYLGNRAKGDRLLHNGVYYWYCKFQDYTGIWHEKQGTVSLLR
jgi:gliding motility-associated-like protein